VKCFVQGRGYRILQTFGDEMVGNLRFYSWFQETGVSIFSSRS
jgi:hypothetical protein